MAKKKSKRSEIKFNAATPEYAFLSNMYPSPFFLDDRWWTSVEQYFNYKKLNSKAGEDKKQIALTKELKTKILGTIDPFKAKYFGSKKAGGAVHPKWDKTQRLTVMEKAHRAKFTHNPVLLTLLLRTDGHSLIEEAPWDDFWGNGKDGDGENRNGLMLEALRDEILKEIKDTDNVKEVFDYCASYIDFNADNA